MESSEQLRGSRSRGVGLGVGQSDEILYSTRPSWRRWWNTNKSMVNWNFLDKYLWKSPLRCQHNTESYFDFDEKFIEISSSIPVKTVAFLNPTPLQILPLHCNDNLYQNHNTFIHSWCSAIRPTARRICPKPFQHRLGIFFSSTKPTLSSLFCSPPWPSTCIALILLSFPPRQQNLCVRVWRVLVYWRHFGTARWAPLAGLVSVRKDFLGYDWGGKVEDYYTQRNRCQLTRWRVDQHSSRVRSLIAAAALFAWGSCSYTSSPSSINETAVKSDHRTSEEVVDMNTHRGVFQMRWDDPQRVPIRAEWSTWSRMEMALSPGCVRFWIPAKVFNRRMTSGTKKMKSGSDRKKREQYWVINISKNKWDSPVK